MKKIKKLLTLVLVFAIVLSVIPAISVEAKSGVIKKTAKKKFIVEKFDDQDEIDEITESYHMFPFSDYVAIVNECGGCKGISEGNRLNPNSDKITKGQIARSLKNMYGKYSGIKKADLINDEPATEYWLTAKIAKILKKRHLFDYAKAWEDALLDIPKEGEITKIDYIIIISQEINSPGMDPRVDYKYSE